MREQEAVNRIPAGFHFDSGSKGGLSKVQPERDQSRNRARMGPFRGSPQIDGSEIRPLGLHLADVVHKFVKVREAKGAPVSTTLNLPMGEVARSTWAKGKPILNGATPKRQLDSQTPPIMSPEKQRNAINGLVNGLTEKFR
jgi:hypothetical protein